MSHNSLIKKYSLIVLIIILSFSTKIFSQDLEKIKNSDTIYIFFKQNFKNQMLYPSNKKDAKAYYESIKVFLEDSLNDNLGKKQIVFRFFIDDFLSYLFNYNNITITKNKNFIDHNKDMIIDYNFLKQIGLREAKYLFESKQNIYLIDYNSISGKTVKLKKVKIDIIETLE
jgi:hypothetical protein